MSEELKVKFEEMIDSHQFPTPEDKAEIVSYCEAAYNLGKADEEATIENLASRVIELEELIKPMGDMINYFDKHVPFNPEYQDVYLNAKKVVEKITVKSWDNSNGGWPEPNGIVG
jgi:hypothetical protein